ncbi:MAG TPA: four helix bundle protein [Gemmatimonadaceae bacterium]|nr:four helix bundle protein [Gemmatimonadaceae bacterium]
MPSPNGVRAWQAAIQVAERTRQLVALFPRRGYADLRDQMTRSSESIGNNIAEGRGSSFEREYIKYLDTAARSANELTSQLVTVMEYGIVPRSLAFHLNGTVICTRRMIESLRDVVQANYEARERQRRADARSRRKVPKGKRAKKRVKKKG